jgi:outer membrane protein assembly factor BamB
MIKVGQIRVSNPGNARSHREKGHFTPPNQPTHGNPMEKAWAYPVIANGKLYVRDKDLLWCYDIQVAK